MGVRPCLRAAASEAMISVAAPSLTPDELLAVTVPPLTERRRQFAEHFDGGAGADVLSLATTTGSPLRCGIVTGVISLPTAAFPERRQLSPGCGRRRRPDRRVEMPKSSATFSPVSGMESMPYCFFISGLT